jgi:hypothetical protein
MTKVLKQAFDKAAQELPEYEQDALGEWLLKAIEADEHDWEMAFARSQDRLEKLADEASKDFQTGRTERLDRDKL